jgi:hypothetical protein
MGLSELVLKVPASEVKVTSRPPPQPQAGTVLEGSTTRNTRTAPTPVVVVGSGPPGSTQTSAMPVPTPAAGSAPGGHHNNNTSNSTNHKHIKSKMKKPCSKTHSRESSGASNLSVRFTVNDETVRQVSSSAGSNNRTNIGSSNEDITLSDRLSQDLDEELLDDEDDGFHPGSKSCESIPHDRLTPYAEDGGMR